MVFVVWVRFTLTRCRQYKRILLTGRKSAEYGGEREKRREERREDLISREGDISC
jgi:hypothetical protein